ncbi:hypothetical protein GAY33_11985 [Azospirillum brasilense]|uniref:hypothetical protein n=1 Tax=Azospirillum argentinense TaxID=2970906 RepID=UPI00190BAB1C|nr:hypothetical protein [Azospirillum argentinense]MBK3799944.1 hypothetical protein [Azospirillum argentinense]
METTSPVEASTDTKEASSVAPSRMESISAADNGKMAPAPGVEAAHIVRDVIAASVEVTSALLDAERGGLTVAIVAEGRMQAGHGHWVADARTDLELFGQGIHLLLRPYKPGGALLPNPVEVPEHLPCDGTDPAVARIIAAFEKVAGVGMPMAVWFDRDRCLDVTGLRARCVGTVRDTGAPHAAVFLSFGDIASPRWFRAPLLIGLS